MPLPATVKVKVAVLEEGLVWEALEETMITMVQTLVMATILEWMGLCIQMELRWMEK
jgi:hypothetical protein